MSDLIERLRRLGDDLNKGYKDRRRKTCATLREAADEIERLTAENEVLREDNLTLMATNAEQFKDSERLTAELDDCKTRNAVLEDEVLELTAEGFRLQARVEKLESERKRDCVAFFQWWWNQPGSNTAQGYDEWIAATEQVEGDARGWENETPDESYHDYE